MKQEIDKYYQNEAKRIVDNLFDAKVFNPSLTRDDMQNLEDLIAFYFQTFADSVRKTIEFTNSIEELKKNK